MGQLNLNGGYANGIQSTQARVIMQTAESDKIQMKSEEIQQQKIKQDCETKTQGSRKNFESYDLSLSSKLDELDAQKKAINTETEATKKIINENVGNSFKYFA